MSEAPSNRRPSGLIIPMHAGIRGQLHWRVLDERGVPEIPRNASGFAIAPIEGVTQHNLITDLGLDAVGTNSVLSTNFQGLRHHFHVGEGSTPPAFSDTTLDAEVQRGSTTGQQFASSPCGYDAVNNLFWIEVGISRAVTMTANRVLTEFGFGTPNTTDVYIRELFRDGGGNPVSISLLNGKVLDVLHALRIEIAAPVAGAQASMDVDRYDAANQLINSTPYPYTYGPFSSDASGTRVMGVFDAWDPAGTNSGSMYAFTAPPPAYAPIMGNPGGVLAASSNPQPYVPQSFQRARASSWPIASAVGNIYGVTHKRDTGFQFSGFILTFDDGASFAKSNAETLEASYVSSWARL